MQSQNYDSLRHDSAFGTVDLNTPSPYAKLAKLNSPTEKGMNVYMDAGARNLIHLSQCHMLLTRKILSKFVHNFQISCRQIDTDGHSCFIASVDDSPSPLMAAGSQDSRARDHR